MDGTQALQHEFKSLLNRHGHPVPPVIIVDMLSSEEGEIPINMFLEKYIKYNINSWYAWSVNITYICAENVSVGVEVGVISSFMGPVFSSFRI